MADPSWQRACDQLAASLRALERKTASIRRSTNKLLTMRDVNRERERVKETMSAANSSDVQALQEELKLLERYMQLNSALNTEGVKLMTEANSAIREYQLACDNFYKKCISVEESSRGKLNTRASQAFRDGDSDDDAAEQQGLLQTQASTERVMVEDDVYQEIMAERVRETREIAENVRDINEIFQHINEMVGDQGVQLEIIDSNVSAAERSTRNANQQLRRAYQYQESSPRNKYYIIIVLIALGVCTLLFIAS